MNIFHFYYSVVLRYIGQERLSQEQSAAIELAFKTLRSQFGKSDKIDYSDDMSRLAYMLHYAPKHAIMWREYMRKKNTVASRNLTVNSLGTGPGSELIGIMEGVRSGEDVTWSWFCHDSESGWLPLLSTVAEEYAKVTNVPFVVNLVDDVSGLSRGNLVIGSFLLSEIVKQPEYRKFQKVLKEAVGPTVGRFLDITKCRLEDGSEPFLSDVYRFGFENLKKSEVPLKEVINNEMATCGHSHCMYSLPYEPSINMFLPDLK